MTRKIDSGIIDDAVSAAFSNARNETLKVDDVLDCMPAGTAREDSLRARIARELDASEYLFNAPDSEDYILRCKFFTGSEFLLTPGELEISNGILFPGHRFLAFCHEEIFPSEVTLLDRESGQAVETGAFTSDVTAIVPFHILMGSEQLFDFFVAENPANSSLLDKQSPASQVTLNVFNLRAFYELHGFTFGDALKVKVKNWHEGVFSFSYLSGAERRNRQVKEWISNYSAAMEDVIDRFDNYLEIPDQLRWAFFTGGKRLFGSDGASLDEFYAKSENIAINFEESGHTVLSRKATDETPDKELEIPDSVTISQGNIASFQVLLSDIGSPLKPIEVDSYILGQSASGNLDFDAFFRRCFGCEALSFADDAQEAVFMNMLEDRWERLTARYNYHADEPKAELRNAILELIDARIEWLEELKSLDIDPAQMPEAEMRKIAEASLYACELLELLNSDQHTLQPGEADNLFEAIENISDMQEEYIDKINAFLQA